MQLCAQKMVKAGNWKAVYEQLAQGTKVPLLNTYYASGIPEADTPIKDVELVALDIETTDLDPSQGEILSIGLVPMTMDRIRLSAAKYWLIKPSLEINASSVAYHGITHSQVDKAPSLDVILEEFLEEISGKIVVVHYSRIERGFLDAAFKSVLSEGINFPVIDTIELEARVYRSTRRVVLDWLMFRKNTSIRLTDCRERYGLPYYNQHHALTDACACGELLQAQLSYRFSSETPLGELWS